MKHKRQKPDVRKEAIVAVALRLAEELGHYSKIHRKQITDELGVSVTVIHYHFGTMAQLHRAVVRAAIASENLAVIAQALVSGDPHAKAAPDEVKRRALEAAA